MPRDCHHEKDLEILHVLTNSQPELINISPVHEDLKIACNVILRKRFTFVLVRVSGNVYCVAIYSMSSATSYYLVISVYQFEDIL